MSRKAEIDLKTFMKQNRRQPKIPVLESGLEYLAPKDYATYVKIHPMTIYEWLREGRIEGAVKMGGRWKIPIKSAQ
ncbi:MAG: helix-turn-helix domain-containing protein [Defluviitaleaceae bacterium]|nr:helix-turn-helix domain-containing protein [Defluviitaleaceae bacterium]